MNRRWRVLKRFNNYYARERWFVVPTGALGGHAWAFDSWREAIDHAVVTPPSAAHLEG